MTVAARLAALPVHAYRVTLRPLLGNDCRFVPSCSDYALEAVARHGAVRGLALAGGRLLRCGPWCRGGFDPVPPKRLSARDDCAARRSSARG